METYRIEDVTFTYPERETAALESVSLCINQGDFVLLCGPSGGGKTTLLRLLKPAVSPRGALSGGILFEGTPLAEISPRESAEKIGFVSQSPENQIVTDKVWHELAFGLESLGVSTAQMRLRVAEIASFFGIQTWFHQDTATLSGGQKQLLALASVMVMQPTVLILDEPTAQLDPIAAGEFLATLGKINRELGVTIILTEHRLEEVFPLATQVVMLERGRVVGQGTPRAAGLALWRAGSAFFAAMPTPMRVWAASSNAEAENEKCPTTIPEGVVWLSRQKLPPPAPPQPAQTLGFPSAPAANSPPNTPAQNSRKTRETHALRVFDVHFRYEKKTPDVLKGVSFTADYGEIFAILGGNGTGKSTTLAVAAGLRKPLRGKVVADQPVYLLAQNPQTLFLANTVLKDLQEITPDPQKIVRVTALCRLESLLTSHPYDLSGGEQQRAALAKILLLRPKILLLDEPTKGLDALFKRELAQILHTLARDGTAIVLVSHDIEFCAAYAHRCALFFDGQIIAENAARPFFAGNRFYTTAANRMARRLLPDAVTAEDIIAALKKAAAGKNPS